MTWWLPWKFIFETLLALHGTFVDQQVKRYQSWSLSISSKRQWLNNSFAQHLVCQSLRRVVWSCRCHLQCKWCTAQTEPKTAKANLSSNCTWGKTTWNILYRVINGKCVLWILPEGRLKTKNGITQPFLLSWYMDILIFWCLSVVRWEKSGPFRAVPK